MKVERAKFSNKLFYQVKDGATTQDLKALVDSIKDFQPRLENLFDQARYVDQYGTMPKVQVKQGEASPDTWLLKDKGVNSSTSAVKF